VPSIGLSVIDYSSKPDFSAAILYGERIIKNTMLEGLPVGAVCLNVNFPKLPCDEIKGELRYAGRPGDYGLRSLIGDRSASP
jgi:5'-nucleotidase